jgi:hypothetical protein
MKRKEALQLTATIMGIAVFGSEVFLAGCRQTSKKNELFKDQDLILMDEIGETILPDSDRSPGAKAAEIGKFMKVIVTDCYSESEQSIFKYGLLEITNRANQQFNKDFLTISDNERFALLTVIDKESKKEVVTGKPHFYTMFKQLTIWGYFTSEIGQTKALRYNPIPGGFNGIVDYKPGDRAWVGPLCSID